MYLSHLCLKSCYLFRKKSWCRYLSNDSIADRLWIDRHWIKWEILNCRTMRSERLWITRALCVVYPAPVFQFPQRYGERVTQMMYRQTCFVLRALRQKPPPSGFCWSLWRRTWHSFESHGQVSHLHPHHQTRPYHKCLPLVKGFVLKNEASTVSPWSPAAFSLCLSILLSSFSLGDCFSSTCGSQISVSCSPACCEQVDQETWPQRQRWRSTRSWWGRIQVSVTLSLSLLYLCLSLSGTWVSVTVGRCWHMEEPRSPCWWWKVTSTFCLTFFHSQILKESFHIDP